MRPENIMAKKTDSNPLPRRLSLYGGTVIDADTTEPLLLWGTPSPDTLDRSLDIMHLLVDAYNRQQEGGSLLMPAALVAKEKGVPADTVRAAIRAGRLAGKKVGGNWFADAEAVPLWSPQERERGKKGE